MNAAVRFGSLIVRLPVDGLVGIGPAEVAIGSVRIGRSSEVVVTT